jgi:sarcosine oxidase/L-pipecolate oxidase
VAVDSEYKPIPYQEHHTNTTDSAFKFLPVMPKYVGQAFNQNLPAHLAKKWRFRTEYQDDVEAFLGDGSRGGPERREFNMQEKAKL